MPRLLLFAPCEKIIIDKESNATTLIQILESVAINIPQGEESKLPEDAQIPFSWHVLALWQTESKDEDKKFEMRFDVELPKGTDRKKLQMTGVMSIDFEQGKPNFRNVINIIGFPIVPSGTCLLRLFVREIGDVNEWKFIADFPLLVLRPSPMAA